MRTNALGYTRASRLLAGAVVRVHQVRFSAHERVLLVVTLYVSQFSVVNELARTEAPRLAAGVVDGHSKNRESGGGDGPQPVPRLGLLPEGGLFSPDDGDLGRRGRGSGRRRRRRRWQRRRRRRGGRRWRRQHSMQEPNYDHLLYC